MSERKMKGLGRGLNALFEDEEQAPALADPQISAARPDAASAGGGRLLAGIAQLSPGPFQPRQSFDSDALDQLAESIKTHGLLQPIVVRRRPGREGEYHIIAGERRWRAAQKARLHEVPIIITDLGDAQALEIALIENLQREDLNPVEEALGYKRLADEFGHTQEKLAASIGKSRPHIANMMRLLQLPPKVLALVRAAKLSAGHARALITSKDPETLANQVISKGLSVRQTEDLVALEAGRAIKAQQKKSSQTVKDADSLALERDLSHALGMNVTLEPQDAARGSLRIAYKSLGQLDDLIKRLR